MKGIVSFQPIFRNSLLAMLSIFVAFITSCGEDAKVIHVYPIINLLDQSGSDEIMNSRQIDLGNVAINSTKEYSFTIQNKGEGKLEISDISIGWDSEQSGLSLVIEKAKDGKQLTLSPGETTKATLTFSPVSKADIDTSFEILSNSIDDPDAKTEVKQDLKKLSVKITAHAIPPDLSFNPGKSIEFGSVVILTEKLMTIKLTNNSSVPLNLEFTPMKDLPNIFSYQLDREFVEAEPTTSDIPEEGQETAVTKSKLLTLQGKGRMTLDILFKPIATESYSDSFKIIANKATSYTIKVTGKGVESGLVCNPAQLDFGFVNPGACMVLTTQCTNPANKPITITKWELINNPSYPTSPAYSAEDFPGAITLEEGKNYEIHVTFCPEDLSEHKGWMAITHDAGKDITSSQIIITMEGTGGGPDIEITPPELNFSTVSIIAPSTRQIVVANTGYQDLEIASIVHDSKETGAFQVVGTLGEQGEMVPLPNGVIAIPAGEPKVFLIRFAPTAEKDYESTIKFLSNDSDESEKELIVRGIGKNLPDCSYKLVPTTLNFGIVERGRTAIQDFVLSNEGDVDCYVTIIELTFGSDTAFSLVKGKQENLVIAPKEKLSTKVAYLPKAYSTPAEPHKGSVEFYVSSSQGPDGKVSLLGNSFELALRIVPDDLDFGNNEIGCVSKERIVTIYNTGGSAVNIKKNGIYLEVNPNNEFTIKSITPQQTSTGWNIAQGSSVKVELTYAPIDNGLDASMLTIELANGDLYKAAVKGTGMVDAVQTDIFHQVDKPEVDILFIVDDSCSMIDEQESIAANFSSFIEFATKQNLDYHIAVTTTDLEGSFSSGDSENGRFVPLDNPLNRVITPQTLPSPNEVFSQNVLVGTEGSGTEQGLEAAYLALSDPLINTHNAGFLRLDSHLSIVFVSDEEDQSDGTFSTVADYLNFFQNIKGFRNTNLFSANAIILLNSVCGSGGGGTEGTRYKFVAESAGGVVEPICTPDWSISLQNLGKQVFGYKSQFFLTNYPEADSVKVKIDGNEMQQKQDNQTLWSYDTDANSVGFSPFAIPEPGSEIAVTYSVACGGN